MLMKRCMHADCGGCLRCHVTVQGCYSVAISQGQHLKQPTI